jgi:hypothetical protein
MPGLGRLKPPDWEHVRKFPLAAAPEAAKKGTPVVLGINWYTAFDRPEEMTDNRWWITSSSTLGRLRGGHAICVKPGGVSDPLGWWDYYDQTDTPECVGFSESRMMSLFNRTRYNAPWLYGEAQKIDGIDGPHDGTSVRAGLEVLRTRGHERQRDTAPRSGDGITAYRWALSVDEILNVINMPLATRLGALPLLNSWGTFYPHIVWFPGETIDRMLGEDGEAGVPTDR